MKLLKNMLFAITLMLPVTASATPGVFPDLAGTWVTISGTVEEGNTPICAMVLANGQHMFSCAGDGVFIMSVPLDTNGQYKVQIYADGFLPNVKYFDGYQLSNAVQMERPYEACTATTPNDPGMFPDQSGNWVNVSGTVKAEDGTPICAMVLANGQHMFSCGANQGVFSMNIPLDASGQYKLQVYADGWLPNTQRYSSYQLDNDVVMERPPARSCEPDDRVDTQGWTFGNPIPTAAFSYFSEHQVIITDIGKSAWLDGMIAYAPFGGSRLHALYETWISNDYVWGQPSNTGSWTLVADGVIGATNAHQYIDFLIPNNARFIKIIHTGDIGLNGDIWDYFHSIGYLESLPTI